MEQNMSLADKLNNNMSLSDKLRQKLKAKKIQRSNTSQQEAYLKQKKVPTEMMDSYLKAMKHQSAPNVMSMMQQLTSVMPSKMAPPSGLEELTSDENQITGALPME
jgi:hypothetical protein